MTDLVKEEKITAQTTEAPEKLTSTVTSKKSAQIFDIPPEFFDTLVTNRGVSISDFNKSGLKVILFVMRHFACPYCVATIDDIYNLHDSLLKNGCIPILVHMESDESMKEYYSTTERKKEFLELHRIRQTDQLLKYLNMKHITTLASFGSFMKFTLGSKTRKHLLEDKIVVAEKEFLSKAPKASEQVLRLSAAFVIQDRKIVFHVDCGKMEDRIDFAKIIVETELDGPMEFSVHTEAYSCVRNPLAVPLKKKQKPVEQLYVLKLPQTSCLAPTMEEDLPMELFIKNPKDLKLLKTFMTKEYNVENINFYEAILNYKKLANVDQMKTSSAMIFDLFFLDTSPNLLNVTKEQTDGVQSRLETPDSNMFDDVLNGNVMTAMKDSFSRFVKSDIYIEKKMHRAMSFVMEWK